MKTKAELPACPVATAVSLIGGKWKLLILRNLQSRPWRFNELQRDLDGISQKVLTDSLRQMIDDGPCLPARFRRNAAPGGIRADRSRPADAAHYPGSCRLRKLLQIDTEAINPVQIPPLWHAFLTGFMKRPDFTGSAQKSCQSPIRIRTETAACTGWISEACRRAHRNRRIRIRDRSPQRLTPRLYVKSP